MRQTYVIFYIDFPQLLIMEKQLIINYINKKTIIHTPENNPVMEMLKPVPGRYAFWVV